MSRKAKLTWLAALGVVAYLAACLFAAVVLVDGSFRPYHSAATHPPGWLLKVAAQHKDDEVEIRSGDGTTLRAWYFEPENLSGTSGASRGSVILLHGLGDNRGGLGGQAELLLRQGYRVLMPDSRGHGESGGELVTYGVLETRYQDLSHWITWLDERDKTATATNGRREAGRRPCVYGVGVSMGAAILLESLAKEKRFCGVIAEASFSSFRQIAYDRIGQNIFPERWHVGPWFGESFARPIIGFGMIYSRWHYGVDLEAASPKMALAHSETPVLLIDGLADSNIPPYHSELIHAANPRTILWEVPRAEHGT